MKKNKKIQFHVVTLFPEVLSGYLESSILGRAQDEKAIAVNYINPRDYTSDKHRTADDRPYGGGPGMVMKAEPVLKAVTAIKKKARKESKFKIIIFSTQGEQFSNVLAKKWQATFTDYIFICGRYEGVDARVRKALRAQEISIGPYVLTGGELPAMVCVDAITRQIPGVLGNQDSLEEGRASGSEMYTRPEGLVHEGKSYKVPKVLISGNHKEIDKHREKYDKKGENGSKS